MKGTADTPPWVKVAMANLDGSDNLTSSALPISGDYQPQISEIGDVTLGTLRQEKELIPYPPSWEGGDLAQAGFTCSKCPVPWRRLEECGEPYRAFVGKSQKPVWKRKWLNTKRCKPCNSKMKRWQRAHQWGDRIRVVEHLTPKSFVAFVTLTIPNIPAGPDRGSIQDEVRKLKKRVQKFRRLKKFENSIVGGLDAYEYTERPDGSWNVHHHGIWIMTQYWDQRELQDQWGYRTHIEKVRKKHAVVKYLTCYVSKDPIPGIRCLETFRQLRGSAYDALYESAVRLKSNLDCVADATDFQSDEGTACSASLSKPSA